MSRMSLCLVPSTALFALLTACGGEDPVGSSGATVLFDPQAYCTINQGEIHSSAGKDAIPALTNPTFVTYGGEPTSYLRERSRVIGFFDGDQPMAIPLNIMWYHEIINMEVDGSLIIFTHCPLTGSTLAFNRGGAQDAEFGVSGLLYQNNLVMYDRAGRESLWPQMWGAARCGDLTGTRLAMMPVIEMTWGAWEAMHPNTLVTSAFTGHPRPYDVYPYPFYDIPENPQVPYPMEIDLRRPPKERVLGIPSDIGGVALPFGTMDQEGPVSATHLTSNGRRVVVFWDRAAEGAGAFVATLDGAEMNFLVENGVLRDKETGSSWRVDGLATEGPLAGVRLEPIPDAFVAYWFAWPAFYPDIQLRG